MFLPLDPTSGLPIYRQIIDQVRRTLASGVLSVGDRLPSVRELSALLQINPLTVAKAYRELEREGLLEMRRGLGMFVAALPKRGAPAEDLEAIAERFALEALQAGLTQGATVALLKQYWREIKQRDSRTEDTRHE